MGKHKDHKRKKHKKGKKHKKEIKYSSSSSSNSEDEWVEKELIKNDEQALERESWMSLSTTFNSYSSTDKRQDREEQRKLEKQKSVYNPCESVRELNPYWKGGGDGMPSIKFKRPLDDGDSFQNPGNHPIQKDSGRVQPQSSSNWRKKTVPDHTTNSADTSHNSNDDSNKLLSENEMNALAAKLVKAEIMGNIPVIYELRQKLEDARKAKEKIAMENHSILLTETDSKGFSRPFKMESTYGEYSGSSHKKQKVETHKDRERVRYFPDDDKYSLKQMFENEKFNSVEDEARDFVRLTGQVGKNDDLDDLFTDNIRRKKSDERIDKRNRDKAIREHEQTIQTIENCTKCIQSANMQKHLMVSLGETIYLCLPHHEPLTDGHCMIIPTRHVSCCTNLEENEWSELLNYRRALVQMFANRNEDVIFIETAMFLSRHPHMSIQCVPLPKEQGDLAPIYFRKAIDESETEWSSNKKLVSLAGRDVRKAIPKGLPYFSVSFGMQEGFAHVIEDQRLFPVNFGQEIIGGMLDLHHSKWKKPKKQSFTEQKDRVLKFSQEWNKYECATG
ncbi:CWF19-like protein 2 homolog [Agrilus planipennis]|uniref:CWF19-like protein 2 homolog n=1 Tax=Agrilus planipennis TaxID=224129 RepID=A0A1W4WNJ4_AGRPL|nr:CWF19-like protein 2 homolog [Agrilus planipennis]